MFPGIEHHTRTFALAAPLDVDWRPHPAAPGGAAIAWWKDALTLLLLALALPWMVTHLIRDPERVLTGKGPGGPA